METAVISKGRTGSSFGGLGRYLLDGRGASAAERGLQDYLLDGRSGTEQDRVAWAAERNLPINDARCAAVVMDDTAAANPRVKKPVYHLSLSAAPGESFSREQWEAIADRLLKRLKLEEHQALLVAHRDKAHEHVHVMVNRVHPETLKAWDNGHDYYRRERALRHIERELGLREVPGPHYRLPGQERPAPDRGLTGGERQEKERTGAAPWAEQVRARIREDVKTARTWAELEARLKEHGLHLRKRGRGLVITDGERMVKASRVHRGSSYAKLAERFGFTFEEWRRDREALLRAATEAERVARLRAELERRQDRYSAERRRPAKVLEQFRNVNRSARREWGRFEYYLERAYRPGQLRAVRRQLRAVAYREGWARATQVLNSHPERLGRLRGVGLANFGSDARYRAVWAAHYAANTLDRLRVIRGQRRQLRPLVRPAAVNLARAQRRYRMAARLLRGLPAEQKIEKHLARLGMRLGMRAVRLVLPTKLVETVRVAVRAVRLARWIARARESERDMGRGM
jgi:hypothetical protein